MIISGRHGKFDTWIFGEEEKPGRKTWGNIWWKKVYFNGGEEKRISQKEEYVWKGKIFGGEGKWGKYFEKEKIFLEEKKNWERKGGK